MQVCPFCGAPESDRIELEGRRFLIFPCMFTPEVDPAYSEEHVAELLANTFRRGQKGGYFQGMCDQLHLYVTKGEGAKRLLTPRAGAPTPGSASEGSAPPADSR
ncbi:MAG: hypothetical protein L3J96_02950 [Thermoplasmata archaeon]|nr:hypothetical protein [Thermoplasmata archaeon]